MDPEGIVVDDHFADHIFKRNISKILSRPALGQHHIKRRSKRLRTAQYPYVLKNCKVRWPGENCRCRIASWNLIVEFPGYICPILDRNPSVIAVKCSGCFKTSYLILDAPDIRNDIIQKVTFTGLVLNSAYNPIDPAIVGMKFVE